ncbi:MAG: Fic family protein, partial [Bacteroidetes bacterium]|nr:Fic family protein [Bacteroidota bacterium]
RESIVLVQAVRDLMQHYKEELKRQLPKLYSQDLLNNLFRHPYTKIEFVMDDLQVSRLTATRYLDLLTEKGLVIKQKMGRSNYYINEPLLTLFLKAEQYSSPSFYE